MQDSRSAGLAEADFDKPNLKHPPPRKTTEGSDRIWRLLGENGASVAAMILTTEALITDLPEKDKAPAMPGGGGMDY